MFLFFFFNDTATTEIYTLSLHDALPISGLPRPARCRPQEPGKPGARAGVGRQRDVTHREPQRDARPAGVGLDLVPRDHPHDDPAAAASVGHPGEPAEVLLLQ